MAIKQADAYEPYAGYTTYEGSDFPGFDWTFNEEQGGWTKPTPNPNTPSQFSLEDIKNRSGYAFDPIQDKLVTDFKDESLDPNAYYKQLAKDLAEASFNISGVNGDSSKYDTLIEGLKDVNPQAYYTAKIDVLSRAAGNNYINNEMGRMDTINNQIQALLPEAQKAGVTPDQINTTYEGGFSGGTKLGQQVLANKGGGAFLTPLVEGIKFVGPGLLGMYGIDAALTAGLGAGYGAASGMSTVGLGSGLGGAAALDGALATSIGSGLAGNAGVGVLSSLPNTLTAGLQVPSGSALAGTTAGAYTVPAGGAVSSLGSLAWNPPAIGGSAGFLNPVLGADVASTGIGLTAADIPSLTTGLEVGTSGALQNLDPSSNLLSNAGDLLKGAQLAKGLLGVGKNPLQPQSQPQSQQQMQGGRQYAGVDYSPILNLLNIQQPQRNRNSLLG